VASDPVGPKQQQGDHLDKMSSPQETCRDATPAYGEPKKQLSSGDGLYNFRHSAERRGLVGNPRSNASVHIQGNILLTVPRHLVVKIIYPRQQISNPKFILSNQAREYTNSCLAGSREFIFTRNFDHKQQFLKSTRTNPDRRNQLNFITGHR
jgi:hypothetical protein